jgi:hypothetical protein
LKSSTKQLFLFFPYCRNVPNNGIFAKYCSLQELPLCCKYQQSFFAVKNLTCSELSKALV